MPQGLRWMCLLCLSCPPPPPPLPVEDERKKEEAKEEESNQDLDVVVPGPLRWRTIRERVVALVAGFGETTTIQETPLLEVEGNGSSSSY